MVVFAALGNLGIQTTSFVAVLGAMGLAIGMALKDTFSSVGAGILIVSFKPFGVGDSINTSGVAGTVESINIFSTVLKTGDNRRIIIPNSKIISNNIVNESAKKVRRVELIFGIGYDDDLKKAKTILEEIVDNEPKILKSPTPVVAVCELAASSVNFTVRAWVKTPDFTEVQFILNETVKLKFDEEGISIPYPQLEVTQKNSEAVK
ncbi:MAG: mechanosensitive ion channel family protein [Campylobacteraceae bacterium]